MSADSPTPPSPPPPAPPAGPKPGPGRPSKLTPALQEEICRAIAASGASLTDAARIAGVDYSSLKRWIQKGKAQRRGVYRAFLAAVEQARSEDKVARLARVTQAGRGSTSVPADWRADAWALERIYQAEFAPRVHVHVEKELRAGIARLLEAFESDTRKMLTKEEALELAIDALAGDAGPAGTRATPGEEDAPADSAGGEAVRSSPPQPEAEVVPRAHGD